MYSVTSYHVYECKGFVVQVWLNTLPSNSLRRGSFNEIDELKKMLY